jgi:hypothetical protein
VSTHSTPQRVKPSPLVRMRVHAFACAHFICLRDANCRCAGTTSAADDGRGGGRHGHTAVYYRCEYSQYPGEYVEHPNVSTEKYPM